MLKASFALTRTTADKLHVIAVGKALASANRPLVYGGGSKGIMGIVSGACLDSGGKVTGIVPYAMVGAGGEGEKTKSSVMVELNEAGREKVLYPFQSPSIASMSYSDPYPRPATG